MTRRDSRHSKQNRILGMRPAVARYFEFVNQVQILNVQLPDQGASVTFGIPMPASWSEKKKRNMVFQPHKTRNGPDISNLLKALEDATHKNDGEIWNYERLSKFWVYEGYIEIIVKGE